jgi:hypothetical protein
MRILLVLALVLIQHAPSGRAFLAPVFPVSHPRLSEVRRSHLLMSQSTLEKEYVASPEESTVEVNEQSSVATTADIRPKNDAGELSDTQKLMKQVKEAGVAGIVSYALWEVGFWTISVRANCCCAYIPVVENPHQGAAGSHWSTSILVTRSGSGMHCRIQGSNRTLAGLF